MQNSTAGLGGREQRDAVSLSQGDGCLIVVVAVFVGFVLFVVAAVVYVATVFVAAMLVVVFYEV